MSRKRIRAISVATTPTQILPADPARVSIALRVAEASDAVVFLGGSAPRVRSRRIGWTHRDGVLTADPAAAGALWAAATEPVDLLVVERIDD